LLLAIEFGAAPVQAGPVDAAREKSGEGCEDGVGSTYFQEELSAAQDSDTYDGFWARRAACSEDGILSYMLEAMCSPAVPTQQASRLAIYCMATIWNPADHTIVEVTDAQFTLASNTRRYQANEELLGTVPADYALTSEPRRIYPASGEQFVMVFELPKDQAQDELVLMWRVPGAAAVEVDTWRRLQVLLEDREPMVAELPEELGAGNAAAVEGAIFTFTGSTDAVSDAIRLPAGIYVAQSSYVGDDNFAIWMRASDGSRELLANEIGRYRGQATFQLDQESDVLFEVTGIGDWEIAITPAFG
jgi:hypothetical protein